MSEPSAKSPKARQAVIALLTVTVLWGCTFVWMKRGVETTKRVLGEDGLIAGVGLFMTLRFGIAALVMLALRKVRRGLTRMSWLAGLWIGLALLGGFLLQMFGLDGVSPAVSAFLTSLYVLFTAMLTTLRSRKAPHLALVAGALLATFGAAFIGGPPDVSFGLGAWLTLGCAFVFAVHILVTDAWTKRAEPLPATFTCFVVVALGSAATLAIGAAHAHVGSSELLQLVREASFWQPLVLASLLATVLALTLMNVHQRELDPVRAAIVYALEPIWAAAIGIALGDEHPTQWLYIGGAALLAGNLVAEIGPQLLARREPAA